MNLRIIIILILMSSFCLAEMNSSSTSNLESSIMNRLKSIRTFPEEIDPLKATPSISCKQSNGSWIILERISLSNALDILRTYSLPITNMYMAHVIAISKDMTSSYIYDEPQKTKINNLYKGVYWDIGVNGLCLTGTYYQAGQMPVNIPENNYEWCRNMPFRLINPLKITISDEDIMEIASKIEGKLPISNIFIEPDVHVKVFTFKENKSFYGVIYEFRNINNNWTCVKSYTAKTTL